MKDPITKITQSIIANQVALNFNEELIRIPVYYKKELKQKINLLMPVLVKAESEEYDNFFDKLEPNTVAIYNVVREMVEEISSLGIHHFQSITEMAKAYKKSPESIQGIVNKINRQ